MSDHKKNAKNSEIVESIEAFLMALIVQLQFEPPSARGRPRILPALALWAGVLVAVVRGFSSQLDLWRLLSEHGLWDFPRFAISDDVVYKRLKDAGRDTLKGVFEQVTLLVNLKFQAPPQELASFAAGVFALDQTTLDKISKRLPSLRDSLKTVLAGSITALFDIRRQLWRHIEFNDSPAQNEKVSARGILKYIPKGSLILADLGYFGFAWFDELTTMGFHWVSRLRNKTSYIVKHTFVSHNGILDAIVWLGAYRADKAGQAVRLVQFSKNGKTWSYVTNVLDPKVLSIREISMLYARRWDIEMMFNMIKTHLKLNFIWSSHINVVLHQVYAVFTVSQVILATRSEIATRAKVDVFDISLGLLIRWLPRIAAEGSDPIVVLVERGAKMKIIRPSKRMGWSPPEVDLGMYVFPPENMSLVRAARYAGKP
jgi:hypothetical protein